MREAERRDERNAEQGVEGSAEGNVERNTERNTERNVERNVERSAEKRTRKGSEKTLKKSLERKFGKKPANFLIFAVVIVVIGLAFWGPEWMADYWDKNSLNKVISEEAEGGGEGFRYTLGSNEKLYILSKSISNQEQGGSYALVVNRQEPSEREIAEEDIYTVCEGQLRELVRSGILPDEVREVNEASYQAVLYSAIDVLEPRNNLSVWKVSLSTDIRNADKSGRMLDAYLDAETGQIYEFYVRIRSTWEQMEPDKMVNAWAEYLDLTGKEDYDSDNPLLENTPYYKKYRFTGIGEDRTVVTLGFYEGINELFLKISK